MENITPNQDKRISLPRAVSVPDLANIVGESCRLMQGDSINNVAVIDRGVIYSFIQPEDVYEAYVQLSYHNMPQDVKGRLIGTLKKEPMNGKQLRSIFLPGVYIELPDMIKHSLACNFINNEFRQGKIPSCATDINYLAGGGLPRKYLVLSATHSWKKLPKYTQKEIDLLR